VAIINGPAREILSGERVALNFLQHLSGIATLTRQFVSRCPQKTKILDTRKTTPGLRLLEKYAVRVGDGTNHRLGLYDAVLIKDNHIRIAGGIKMALAKAQRKKTGSRNIEVETRNLTEVREAIAAKADRILLDNMDLKTLRVAVRLCRKAKIKTEASGGVKLDKIEKIAKTGVDYISIGALTHSAKALDINLKIVG
jgi:nicotinate-nucleotide pyrophosphorylase (carboxylating)